ncbi:hypothetical protein D3C76_802090 [compost metagenome]
MRRAGHRSESGRRSDQFGARLAQRGIQFGEAQVVAYRQAKPADWRIRDHHVLAKGIVVRFAVTPASIRHVHVEQMQFVIARGDFAVLVDQQGTGIGLGLHLPFRRQRNGPGDDPQAELAGRAFQPWQDRSRAQRLGLAELGQIAPAHGGEVLRQHRQPRTGVGGLLQEATGIGEIGQDIVLADHLDHCDGHEGLRHHQGLLTFRSEPRCCAKWRATRRDGP